MKSIIIDGWTESERGWGQSPDGIRAHLSEEHRQAYNKAYYEANHKEDTVPDVYCRANDRPEEVLVTNEMYDRFRVMSNSKPEWANGIYFSSKRELCRELENEDSPKDE